MMMMMNVLETGRYSVRELRNYCISEINLILSSVISHHLFCHQLGMKTIILSSTWYVNYHPVINLVCKLSLYLRWSWRYRQLMCIHIKHPADVKNFLQKQNKNHYQKCSFFNTQKLLSKIIFFFKCCEITCVVKTVSGILRNSLITLTIVARSLSYLMIIRVMMI